MSRSVSIHNAHPRLRVPRAAVRKAIGLLDSRAKYFRGGCPPGELSLVFLTDPALARIHAEFMNDPAPTDVITFEGDRAAADSAKTAAENVSAGEICLSADTAARYVGLQVRPALRCLGKPGKPRSAKRPPPVPPDGFPEELTLYLVHGWLHLAGYDDRQPARKRQMRAAEKRAMNLLRKGKAIPAFRLA